MMNKFSQMWTDQLRAGAQYVADEAESIVGDLELNQTMSVVINLSPGDGRMEFPDIEIHRRIVSREMTDATIARFQKKEAE